MMRAGNYQQAKEAFLSASEALNDLDEASPETATLMRHEFEDVNKRAREAADYERDVTAVADYREEARKLRQTKHFVEALQAIESGLAIAPYDPDLVDLRLQTQEGQRQFKLRIEQEQRIEILLNDKQYETAIIESRKLLLDNAEDAWAQERQREAIQQWQDQVDRDVELAMQAGNYLRAQSLYLQAQGQSDLIEPALLALTTEHPTDELLKQQLQHIRGHGSISKYNETIRDIERLLKEGDAPWLEDYLEQFKKDQASFDSLWQAYTRAKASGNLGEQESALVTLGRAGFRFGPENEDIQAFLEEIQDQINRQHSAEVHERICKIEEAMRVGDLAAAKSYFYEEEELQHLRIPEPLGSEYQHKKQAFDQIRSTYEEYEKLLKDNRGSWGVDEQ